jgi:hypothetical protein
MAPFSNDWPSSIFISQDPIALESVCYDILKAEFTSDKHAETYPQMAGVDDHLHQAADSANWPAGVRYDPENDGTPLGSLGVHEHWNNVVAMEYSRNLGTGNGIELVKLNTTVGVARLGGNLPQEFLLNQNYPNPFNPTTAISYHLPAGQAGLSAVSAVRLSVYDALGREVALLVNEDKPAGTHTVTWNAQNFPSGVYLYRLVTGDRVESKKMILMK